jgi:hypothetical protein
LDWFHLAMRIQHVAQAASGWPDASAVDREAGARLTETIERIRWRLWHGQVERSLNLMGETKATLEATAEVASPATSAALKVARLLGDLETYVCGQSNIIIDYATARRREEPISTAITESTVQWLLHRRRSSTTSSAPRACNQAYPLLWISACTSAGVMNARRAQRLVTNFLL